METNLVKTDIIKFFWDEITGRKLIARGMKGERLKKWSAVPVISLAMKEKRLRFHGISETIKLAQISERMAEIRIVGGAATEGYAEAVAAYLKEQKVQMTAANLTQTGEKSFAAVIQFQV